MREIALDTETTGLDPKSGHRIVEIGGVELVNHMPTGNTYQAFINPQRDMPVEAFNVHGLSEEFLREQPVMADVMGGFVDFIGDAQLIIHTARFDMGFINAELELLDLPVLDMDRATDTVTMARQRFPGAQANLDALCRRFNIDNSDRELHGALKDARLLAYVYLELIGGRQPDLELASSGGGEAAAGADGSDQTTHYPARPHAPTADEEAAHAKFMEKLEDPVWNM